jgi:hypothetical protein
VLKKKTILLLIAILFILSSCTSAAHVSTPTPTPKPTIQPTPTEIKPPGFSASVTGFEEHGAMIELTCVENCESFEAGDFSVKIFQNGIQVEEHPLEILNNRYLIEMQDTFYQLGEIDIEINYENSNIAISNILYEERYPFLRWLFGDNGITKNVFGGFRDDHLAWDLVFINDEYPKSIGVPIYAISNGIMLTNQIWNPYPDKDGYITNIYAYLEDVGLLYQFGHIDAENPPINTGTCIRFNSGDLLAKIGIKDVISGAPHVHYSMQTLQKNFWHTINDDVTCTYIDPFSNDPFNEGNTYLQYGLFLPKYLPDEVKNAIDNGLFENNFSVSEYNVCLSTPYFSYEITFPCDVK